MPAQMADNRCTDPRPSVWLRLSAWRHSRHPNMSCMMPWAWRQDNCEPHEWSTPAASSPQAQLQDRPADGSGDGESLLPLLPKRGVPIENEVNMPTCPHGGDALQAAGARAAGQLVQNAAAAAARRATLLRRLQPHPRQLQRRRRKARHRTRDCARQQRCIRSCGKSESGVLYICSMLIAHLQKGTTVSTPHLQRSCALGGSRRAGGRSPPAAPSGGPPRPCRATATAAPRAAQSCTAPQTTTCSAACATQDIGSCIYAA